MRNGESNSQFTIHNANYVKSFGASFLFAITDRVRLIELDQKKGAYESVERKKNRRRKNS